MNITDAKSAEAHAREGMNGQVEHVRHELAGIRTGRASVGILDSIRIDAYGTKLPLNQVATLSVPEPTLMVVHPFDPTQISAIERAILSANLGLNPSNDGRVLRIPVPPLTNDRRKDLSRIVHQLSEEGRNHVRNVRRHVNDALKKLLKDHEISEDDERRGLDDIQRVTNDYIKQIDDLQSAKDADLLGQ
jgi:ribosome recycling factor